MWVAGREVEINSGIAIAAKRRTGASASGAGGGVHAGSGPRVVAAVGGMSVVCAVAFPANEVVPAGEATAVCGAAVPCGVVVPCGAGAGRGPSAGAGPRYPACWTVPAAAATVVDRLCPPEPTRASAGRAGARLAPVTASRLIDTAGLNS